VGAPRPRVRLPENFVARTVALDTVKGMLLGESGQTLVVSAIAGLGGLGKSVLATAIVLDPEVQGRFEDGILWVTLGQKPDLQSCLGDCIRKVERADWMQSKLTQDRGAFSTTILNSAKEYLHSLLVDRQMLLVVDDVWNTGDVEQFRVGGSGCRVLVTTRKQGIDGADCCYSLDLMSKDEAIELVRGKLGKKWRAVDEAAFLGFAKSLGYLPLALDLAANWVRDGITWGELKEEFESERRAALRLLDSTIEDLEKLPEEEQRKYSLQACFNLSLNRLNELQRSQFAWLGVLPEDVNLTVATGKVLWGLSIVQTKRVLKELQSRSFLTFGVTTFEGESTYRVHDLMHLMAQGLIEKENVEGLVGAHRAFLERYRGLCEDGQWWQPPYDREKPYEYLYFYRHLTWHLEQADWADEVHELMAMSDDRGRNAWFEACDRIGQPAIFVKSVADGWRLAEELYDRVDEAPVVPMVDLSRRRLQQREQDRSEDWEVLQRKVGRLRRDLAIEAGTAVKFQLEEQIKDAEKKLASLEAELEDVELQLLGKQVAGVSQVSADEWKMRAIVLQCRYALVATTLNDLVENLPIGLMAEFVRRDFWSIEQAWAYIEQIQDQKEISRAILTLAPYLSKSLLQIAVKKARLLADKDCYADILSHLVQIDHVYFAEALEAVRLMKSGVPRTMALSRLAKIDPAYFSEVVDAARSVQFLKSFMWIRLVETDLAYFSAALEEAELIQKEWALLKRGTKFIEELETARSAHHNKSHQTNDLSQTDSSQSINLPEEDELFEENLPEEDLYYLLQLLQDEEAMRDGRRIDTLIDLAQFDKSYFDEALQVARSLDKISDEPDQHDRGSVLIGLAKIRNADFNRILEVARLIQDEFDQVHALSHILKGDQSCFTEIVQFIQHNHKSSWADLLADLARIDNSFFIEALEAAKSIRSESALIRLTQVDGADYTQLLEAGQSIWGRFSLPRQKEEYRIRQAEMLSHIAQFDRSYFAEALEVTRSIQNANSRADGLIRLAQIDNAYFPEALEAALSIQSERRRAYRLVHLAQIDNTYFPKALEAVQSIQDDESGHTYALSELTQIDNADFTQLLEEARLVQSESNRVSVLSELAKFAPKEFLPQIYQAITEITYIPTRTKALNSYFSRVPPVHKDWQSHLHLLAHRKRADLMGDLATLYPAIIHLGGEAAMRGVVEEMKRVCGQWP
jgi:hypothetical protein